MIDKAQSQKLTDEEVLQKFKCAVGHAALNARDGKCQALESQEISHWEEILLQRLARRAAA